jgi:hypothetical protein
VASYEQAHHNDLAAGGAVIALVGGLALIGTVGAAVVAVHNAWRTRDAIKRERWAEVVRTACQREYVAGLHGARSLALDLVGGRSLDPITVWGPVLRRSETAHLDLTIGVSRPITLSTGDYAWTCAVLAQVIVSDRRLLMNAERWQSIWYEDVVGFYPDLGEGRLILDTARAGPVQLNGPASALVAVYVAAVLYGPQAICRHPLIAPLLN